MSVIKCVKFIYLVDDFTGVSPSLKISSSIKTKMQTDTDDASNSKQKLQHWIVKFT